MNITPEDEPLPTDVMRISTLDEVPAIVRRGGPLPRGEVVGADRSATA